MRYAGRLKHAVRFSAMAWLASTLLSLVFMASLPQGLTGSAKTGENILQAALVADLGMLPSRPGGDGGTSGEGQAGTQRFERVVHSLIPVCSGIETVQVAVGDAAVRSYLRLSLERKPGQPAFWATGRLGNSDSEPPCC